MSKMRIFCLMIMLCLITGCSVKQTKQDIDTDTKKENEELTVGFGLENINTGYVYDGDDVVVDFNYNVEGRGSKLGLMIYVNGVPQLLKADGKEDVVYNFEVEKDTIDVGTVSFKPNIGKAGDTLIIQGALIVDCDIVESVKAMENKQHILTCGQTTLTLNKDSDNLDFEDNMNVKYQAIRSDLLNRHPDRENYLVDNLFLEIVNSDGRIESDKNIEVEIFGRPEIYRVWVLEDCRPVQSHYVNLESGQMALINVKAKNKKTRNVRLFAVPINGGFTFQSVMSLVLVGN